MISVLTDDESSLMCKNTFITANLVTVYKDPHFFFENTLTTNRPNQNE